MSLLLFPGTHFYSGNMAKMESDGKKKKSFIYDPSPWLVIFRETLILEKQSIYSGHT